MKICLVSPGFPPDLGGVETVVGHLAAGIKADGHALRVLTHRRRPATRAPQLGMSPEQDDVVRFTDWTHTRQFPLAPGLWRHLRRHGGRYDLLHAHSFHASAAAAAAFMSDQPLVFSPHYHGVGHTQAARVAHLAYDRVATRIFDRASVVVCVSGAEAQLLIADFPGVEGKVKVIPNGVDVASILEAEPYAVDRPVILHAGRLEAYKQVDATLRALREVPDAVLVVVGTGPESAALERMSAELGLADRVRFLGFVSTQELRRWQRTASATVSMSRHEAFGLVLLEAAVAGSQVVASEIPAHVEVEGSLHRRARLVSADAGPGELAEALREALTVGRVPPSVGTVLGWPEIARRTLDVYASVLGTPRGRTTEGEGG